MTIVEISEKYSRNLQISHKIRDVTWNKNSLWWRNLQQKRIWSWGKWEKQILRKSQNRIVRNCNWAGYSPGFQITLFGPQYQGNFTLLPTFQVKFSPSLVARVRGQAGIQDQSTGPFPRFLLIETGNFPRQADHQHIRTWQIVGIFTRRLHILPLIEKKGPIRGDGTTATISSYMGFSPGDKTEDKNNQKHDK